MNKKKTIMLNIVCTIIIVLFWLGRSHILEMPELLINSLIILFLVLIWLPLFVKKRKKIIN